jgi:hypothetical protein
VLHRAQLLRARLITAARTLGLGHRPCTAQGLPAGSTARLRVRSARQEVAPTPRALLSPTASRSGQRVLRTAVLWARRESAPNRIALTARETEALPGACDLPIPEHLDNGALPRVGVEVGQGADDVQGDSPAARALDHPGPPATRDADLRSARCRGIGCRQGDGVEPPRAPFGLPPARRHGLCAHPVHRHVREPRMVCHGSTPRIRYLPARHYLRAVTDSLS